MAVAKLLGANEALAIKTMTLSSATFFEKIGSPRYVAAPMVEQSELAFRLLCRRHGCDLAFSQMLHSGRFSPPAAGKWRKQQFDGQHERFVEHPELSVEDRPLIAQFCGNDPQTLVAAAKYIENYVDAIDLNLGCPQNIARKGNYGAFLLKDADLCERMIGAMSTQLACPVTVKIRCLEKDTDTLILARRLEAAGAQCITVHGRTLMSAKTATGPANWNIIGEIKSALNIPVIANGGIETRADIHSCFLETGCDAVMSSEALLENPALFDPNIIPLEECEGAVLAHRQLALAAEYLEIAENFPTSPGVGSVRAHLFKILYRLVGVHTDLRDMLAKVYTHADQWDVLVRLEQRYAYNVEERKALIDPRECAPMHVYPVSWYRRHRGEFANRLRGTP